jgi:hypothetical protein
MVLPLRSSAGIPAARPGAVIRRYPGGDSRFPDMRHCPGAGMFLHAICRAPTAGRSEPWRTHAAARTSIRILPACQPVLALGRAGTKRSGDAIPGGHCLTSATQAAGSHMASEHLPRTGAPGATPSLTPREPTAFPHRYPCVAGEGAQPGAGGRSRPAAGCVRSHGAFTAVCRPRGRRPALRTGC